MKTPDPTLHFRISIVKSLLRIAAGGALIMPALILAGGLLIAAEILGIAEEIF